MYFYEMVNPAHLASLVGFCGTTGQLFKTYKAGTVSGKTCRKRSLSTLKFQAGHPLACVVLVCRWYYLKRKSLRRYGAVIVKLCALLFTFQLIICYICFIKR